MLSYKNTIDSIYVFSGLLLFSFQIYFDFSGYSDIARGIAKILGIDLIVNFKQPYLSTSPSEFWKRWHISLSQWLRDYIYIPLGGNKCQIFFISLNSSKFRENSIYFLFSGICCLPTIAVTVLINSSHDFNKNLFRID